MPTVSLRFQPFAEHVRTARLVAVAVARRARLAEPHLDEVRLAVGEMCARAVRRCNDTGTRGSVLVEIDDRPGRFEVTVTDQADAPEGEGEDISLALVRGLATTAVVQDGPGGEGGIVLLAWDRSDDHGR